MSRPDLAQLNQRITVRCHLGPLGLEDTVRYIHHRLSVAGPLSPARFDPKAFALIHRFTDGVPRRINALCDRALLVAFAKGSHRITRAFIRQAQRELTGPVRVPGTIPPRRVTAAGLLQAALLTLVILLAAYLGFTRGEALFR